MWPFNTAKAADDILDKEKGLLKQAGEWAGNLHYTEEEKSEAQIEVIHSQAKFIGSTLSESTSRSKSRRRIAERWINAQLGLLLLIVVAAPFNMELAALYLKLATLDIMLYGTLGVMTFFFGPYMLSTHMSGTVGRIRSFAGRIFNKGDKKND